MLPNRSILSALAALFFGFAPALATAQFLKDGQPNVEVQETSSSERPRGYPEFSKLIKELSPAVVNISVEAAAEDEAMEQMFPFLKKEPGQPMRSLGSGCIVSEDGYIITNNHVVDKSERIIVRLLDDKTEYQATLVGKDAKTDLALLKIAPKSPLKWVYFGDSDDLEVGEWVLAIGNQFQLGQTVTAGIVSAKSRRVPNKASGPYDAFIQTDASINPGSS
ncbi:MAG: trypsin-like peptidase domain-containing protein, partial [Deltaproteobacteria bacterium]|nr:trypsin-like peptidase domain-containing protein [Deltaproteobacteria bacterium]